MSSEGRIPKITRNRARLPLIEEIEWRADYNLGKSFREKLKSFKIDIDLSLVEKLWLRARDLEFIFIEIALIVSRINEDGKKFNRKEDLFEIISDRAWNDEEGKEYENYSSVINYLLLDVKTLFVNIMIFMDVLAKFLSLCIKSEAKPKSKNFASFKKHLKKYSGKKLDELKEIIYQNTGWFDNVKDFRDDFVVHHPAPRATLEFHGEVAYIPLTTTKKEYNQHHITNGAITKNVSIQKIDFTLSEFKKLLKRLKNFLCENINVLPFEAKSIT